LRIQSHKPAVKTTKLGQHVHRQKEHAGREILIVHPNVELELVGNIFQSHAAEVDAAP
jgi:hypothetical protein